ncbi:class III lanthionine synthetase LanKC [Saccharomonospora viridis]|uniref:class III lanthionine synthetase LanKC n=1 Tax=Saccharomonospora viridis TaxID=1852 RepID=UPI002409CE71|nr:class III lanthionine synthetase LanKC [Saccharomonospora viridis]
MKPLTELYTLADPVFFEDPIHWRAEETSFSVADHVPEGWDRKERNGWIMLQPSDTELPKQGWKIHVSAIPDHAGLAVKKVSDYCFTHGITFKFLHSGGLAYAYNLKYAPRASSGKLVTIYPRDDHELTRCLTDLDKELADVVGPYILSDLRFRRGPLYVRYGGFKRQWCETDEGERVLAIERPDGTLVPDERRPVFSLPDWVSVPGILQESLDARNATNATLGYRITEALHFSNGGGVYCAHREEDGQEVVLKEARPHAGLIGDGSDAVARLEREARALRKLEGIDGIPRVHQVLQVWEHHFLVMDRVPGVNLQKWLAVNYPLIGTSTTETRRAYTARALQLHERITHLVEQVHRRGVVFADLHPANIMVDDHDNVSLVDFESAFELTDERRQYIGHVGFTAKHKTGVDIDRHGLAVLKLWLFLPLTSLLGLAPDKLHELVDIATDLFDLPDDFAESIRSDAGQPRRPEATVTAPVEIEFTEANVEQLVRSLSSAIARSATPERQDRLFPGDIDQFNLDGTNFAHGAAGILWALHVTGCEIDPVHGQWLVEHAERSGERIGFLDGAHGIAYVLNLLGKEEQAVRLVERVADRVERTRDVTLFSGMAGVGLNLLYLSHDQGQANELHGRDYLSQALRLAVRIEDALASGAPHGIDKLAGQRGRARDAGTHGGLLRGWSGPALFLLRLAEATGDHYWLDLAVRALHRDLDLCIPAHDGSLQVDGGFRTLPYLEVGSAGIALVANEVLQHVSDERISAALEPLVASCHSTFVMEPSLFQGRAGLLATTSRLSDSKLVRIGTRQVMQHLENLRWHSLAYHGHVSFPGHGCNRLSMDFATGNAGVLTAIASVVDRDIPFFPFLSGPR